MGRRCTLARRQDIENFKGSEGRTAMKEKPGESSKSQKTTHLDKNQKKHRDSLLEKGNQGRVLIRERI